MNKSKKEPTYPLIETAAEQLRTASGCPLSRVNLDTVMADQLSADDIRITAGTLRAQAQIAADAGYTQFGANLRRAAELTGVPNEELLHMYEQLRPGRCTYTELIALAERLEEKYQAAETSRLVRQAAEVYCQRGLLKPD
jgi:propanediol dehydratase small subunit